MENATNSNDAQVLLKAEADGVQASLSADGKVLLNGDAAAREKHGPEIAKLAHAELVGAVLASFLFRVSRSGFLDGQDDQLINVISRATAAGVQAGRDEVQQCEGDDE